MPEVEVAVAADSAAAVDASAPLPSQRQAGIWLYAVAIFISAFLLFQIQLIISKYILPWFGGTASVWTTSMLFFQLRAPDLDPIIIKGPGAFAHRFAGVGSPGHGLGGGPLALARDARLGLEASRSRFPGLANHSSADGRRGPALSGAQRDQPVATGLVFARLPQLVALPAVCTVQCRIASRIGCLPVRHRAAGNRGRPGLDVGASVRGIRGLLLRLRVAGAICPVHC
jgi:hypothetical protein